MKKEIQEHLDIISRGSAEIVAQDELARKVEGFLTGKKSSMVIKAGFDPTAPDLHLGHTVLLNKMRQLQDLGYDVQFLIGDFTAMIGDPTGKNETRPPLSRQQIDANAETYKQQVFKLLDPHKTTIRYNSEWFGSMMPADFIKLTSNYTIARLLERDDFTNRFQNNQPIAMHELLYPLVQGYDSVAMKADMELGGMDQKFNLLVGRDLQRCYKQETQIPLMMPLLVGLSGGDKMSKSLGNYVGITDEPSIMFGKLMSIPDSIMWEYYTLLTRFSTAEIQTMTNNVDNGSLHPMEAKKILAGHITEIYHSKQDATNARNEFEQVFSKGENPDDMPEFHLENGTNVLDAIVLCNFAPSKSEARRNIKQGGVSLDGEKVNDPNSTIAAGEAVLKVGKRKFAKIIVKGN